MLQIFSYFHFLFFFISLPIKAFRDLFLLIFFLLILLSLLFLIYIFLLLFLPGACRFFSDFLSTFLTELSLSNFMNTSRMNLFDLWLILFEKFNPLKFSELFDLISFFLSSFFLKVVSFVSVFV